MAELTVKGIVLGGVNYKEKDKILSVFTLEKGLISCKLVGVMSAKAKLKSVKEPFCFAELDLVAKQADNAFYTISSANIIDNFYNIITDIDKYFLGCTILETLKKIAMTENPNEILFLESIKALKFLAYSEVDPKVVLSKFLITIFEASGYALSLDRCAICGDNFINKRYLNAESGEIVCFSCKSAKSEEILPITHASMRLIKQTDYDKLKNLKLKKEGVETSFNLLVKNLENRFDISLCSVNKFPK